MAHQNTTTDERNAAEFYRPQRVKIEADPALSVYLLQEMLRTAELTLVDHGGYYLLTSAPKRAPGCTCKPWQPLWKCAVHEHPDADSDAARMERARQAMVNAGFER